MQTIDRALTGDRALGDAGGAARAAIRLDERRGIREEARFFAHGSESLFGVCHAPAGPATAGLVICPSLHAEFVATYRHEVLLARTLAARGVAVQRFHYRGTGHSDGEPEQLTFETMRADAAAAARLLAETAGVEAPAFLGTRWGGLVAAAAVADRPGAPLVLWDPIADGRRFFREAWRAARIRAVKEGWADDGAPAELADALALASPVDVLGYPIGRAFYEDGQARSLLGELGGTGPRRVLLAQLGARSLRPELERAASALRDRGCAVDVEVVASEVSWWFVPSIAKQRESFERLRASTVAWLDEHLGPRER